MAEFPKQAKVVIIGLGGIVGASIAHHLIERGWDDIVGIDKSGIPTDIGSTAHASDFCYTTSTTICRSGRPSIPSISTRRWATTPASAAWKSHAPATTPGWKRSSAS
jgi:glycine/D-amino acid oxidase-like deaminating enzyme